MSCQDVMCFPRPPGRSQPGVSLLPGNLSVCQSFNVEPRPFRNSESFELNDPSRVYVPVGAVRLLLLAVFGSNSKSRVAEFISA